MRPVFTSSPVLGALALLLLTLPTVSFATTPLDTRGPLHFTPMEAPIVAFAPAIGDVAARIGLPKLFDKYPALFGDFRVDSVRNAGADVLTISGWSQAGIDLTKPMSLAIVDPEKGGFVFWMAVADRMRIEETYRRLMGAGGSGRRVGDAAIFAPRSGSGRFVVRGNWAAIVGIGRGDDRAVHSDKLAEQVATLEVEASVAAMPRWSEVESSMAGNDVFISLDVRRIAEITLVQQQRAQAWEAGNDWAAKKLAFAKEQGESPDRIADLEREVSFAEERNKAWAARVGRLDAFLTRMTSGVGGLVFGARFDVAAITLRGQLLLDEAHPLRSLFKAGMPMALARALSTPPLGLIEAAVDGAVLAQLVKEVVGVLDELEFDAVRELVQRRYELDLDKDLLGRLGGAFGMSFSMKGEALTASFTAGVTDDGAVKGVLDQMAAAERTQEFLRAAHQGSVTAWTLPWSDGEARLRLESGRVSLSSDGALADRIASAKAGTWLAGNPAATWLAQDGVVLIGAMDIGQILLPLAGGYKESARSALATDLGSDPASQKLQKSLAKVEADLAKLDAKDSGSLRAVVAQVARLIGPTALAATKTAAGLSLSGGHVVGGKTIEGTIDGIMAAAVKRKADKKRHRENRAKLEKKSQSLWDAREKSRQSN